MYLRKLLSLLLFVLHAGAFAHEQSINPSSVASDAKQAPPARNTPAAKPVPQLFGAPSAKDLQALANQTHVAAPDVIRERPVSIQYHSLSPQFLGENKILNIALFDDEILSFQLEHFEEHTAGSSFWAGKVVGNPDSMLTITMVNGHVIGHIQILQHEKKSGFVNYTIDVNEGGVYFLHQIDVSKHKKDSPNDIQYPDHPSSGNTGLAPSSTAMASLAAIATIDVLVVYSNDTATKVQMSPA